jgi:hypothetical protein
MIMVFFTAGKLIVLDVLLKAPNFNQLYFRDDIFPDLKRESARSRRREPGSTFRVQIDNSMFHNGSKIDLKFRKDDLFRMPQRPNSPDPSPGDFWRFGMLKGILKDREFTSSDEIQEAILNVWKDLTLEDVQSVFRNWMRPLSRVIEHGGEYVHE